MMNNEYSDLVRKNILDEKAFVKATFSGQQRGQAMPWNKVIVRPVLIKARRHLQFSYFDAKKDITKNFTAAEVAEKVDELLTLPFKNIHLQTTQENIQIQISKKGKVIIHQHPASEKVDRSHLAHDRRKELLLPTGKADPFLQMIGIMTQDGRVKANMQGKFRQINEFLKLMMEIPALEQLDHSPLQIVDCGCGNAYLTFAVYYYLNQILGLPTTMTGIDTNHLILKNRAEQANALGWDHLRFEATRIIDFQPDTPPHIVLGLHACDTATDEVLAQSVKWQSKIILSAPCCHHHLQAQLNQRPSPTPFKPILRYGVLKERLGDILTDTFRALILRIMGYKTDIVEFVSTEHTGKNLMIRAVKAGQPGNQQALAEYRELKEFWQVTPYLEQLLADELALYSPLGS